MSGLLKSSEYHLIFTLLHFGNRCKIFHDTKAPRFKEYSFGMVFVLLITLKFQK